MPEQCKAWVDKIEKESVAQPPYAKIIDAIHALQKDYEMAPVEYGALRVSLGKAVPPYKVNTNDELIELCKAMAAMAGGVISANEQTVELETSPENALAAIESATNAYHADSP